MADDDSRVSYNSMQQAAGIVPSFAPPVAPTPAQVSAQVAAMGAAQLSQMIAVTQIGQTPMGPFGTPAFPQLQTPFMGSPGFMSGPGGALYPMNPAGAASPYGMAGGAGYGASPFGMAGQMTPPGNAYAAGPMMPPPAYRGPMGMPGLMPFAPPPPLSQFDTPYQAAVAQSMATSDRSFGGMMTTMGMGARLGMDAGMGMLGARIGRRYGGGVGALVGGALGFIGSEVSGMGGFAQNTFMENAALPAMNTRGYGTGLEHLSRAFVSGGPELGPSGAGWSHHGATRAAGGLEDLASSSAFQRETFGRFNTADVMRITQASGQEGLLSGVQTGGDLKGRVREISKSLVSFMELANEPDVLRAIQVMGQMRTSGLSLAETRTAVQNGRMFARTAGTSFEGLANTGGAMGSSAFQSLGLTQGLGMVTGMANQGLATAANNSGAISPQLMNMLGGHQGLGGLNTMFSAGVLQMPMLAPGMMNAQGGIDPAAVRALLSGQISPTGMTARGANTMSAMGQNMGVGGLGMALAMQPLLQDSVGRMIQSQGPFAQRHMEDRQIMALMRNMNLTGSEGFTTAAQMMGMSGPQSIARAREMSDPRYFTRERQQIEINRRERRAEELRDREAQEPGFFEDLESQYGAAAWIGQMGRGIGRGVSDFYRGLAGGGASASFTRNRDETRAHNRFVRSDGYLSMGNTLGSSETSGISRYRRNVGIAELEGSGGAAAYLSAALPGIRLRSLVDGRGSVLNWGADDAAARRYDTTAHFLSTGMHASPEERRRAMSSVNTHFGSRENLNEFATDIAQLYGQRNGLTGGTGGAVANLLFRGGLAGLTRGMLDTGNVSADRAVDINAIRSAFVNRNSSRFSSARAAGEYFDQHRTEIAVPAMQQAMGYMRPVDRERAQSEMTKMFGQPDSSRTGDYESAERRAYSSLIGDGASSRETRRTVDRALNFTGFGRNDRERNASSSYMMARTALQGRLASATTEEERRNIARQITSLESEGQRRGIDVDRANSIADARSQALSGDSRFRDAMRGLNLGSNGASAMATIDNWRMARGRALDQREQSDGMRMLARQDGALGSAFAGVVGEDGKINADRLWQNVASAGASEDALRTIRDPGLREAFRQVASGNARQQAQGRAAIQAHIAATGERGTELRRQYEEMGTAGRVWNRMKAGGLSAIMNPLDSVLARGVGGLMESEDDFVGRGLGGGTEADAAANAQTADSSRMESEAGAQGLGGAADRLVQAAESIERAATAFQRGVQDQNMNSLFNDTART